MAAVFVCLAVLAISFDMEIMACIVLVCAMIWLKLSL
jgi:hypothetical protein